MWRHAEAIGLSVGLALAVVGGALAAKPRSPAKPAVVRVHVETVPLSPRTGSPHGEAGASGTITVCVDPSMADNPTKGEMRHGTTGAAVVAVSTVAYPNGALRDRLAGWKKVGSRPDAASECAFS